MSLLVISPCYYPTEAQAYYMMESAKRNGLAPMLYGVGKPWQSAHGGDEQGTAVIELLQHRSEDYVLACDCTDVLFVAGEAEATDKFEDFGSGLVVSSEAGCHPRNDELLEGLGKHHGGRHKYLNIGLWIGRRQVAIDTLRMAIELYRGKTPDGLDSPQSWLMWGLLQGTLDFSLDRDCVLFQSMAYTSHADIEIIKGRPYNKATGTRPVALHYHGHCGGPIPSRDEMAKRLYDL